ncbi:MAG: DUF6272 family protein [Pseudanabaenaceae cyanobacterium]
MPQIYGKYIDKIPGIHEFLALKFYPTSQKVRQRWKTSGLSANFMADYFATFYPGGENENGINVQAEIKSAVSFIANELLENAMKFSDDSTLFPTSITLHSDENQILFIATNSLSKERMEQFKLYLEKLTNSDPYELYIETIERNAMEDTNSSGLGFLTMINDYAAELGWKFETKEIHGKQVHYVITSVKINFRGRG